ncbi:hypothetical protein [Bradyrhizobium sp. 27S5]|uniref:hypothetical protein n=1 Tax=Bradyrhizobium sp. 27S5 TaxID=3139728 RepID=UPI0030D0BC88
MPNTRIFFAGVGATILLIGTGFGGGLMMAKTVTEPTQQTRATAADRLPPARVILPASSESALPPTIAVPVAVPQQQPQAHIIPATDASARGEKDNATGRAEKHKAILAERDQHRRLAERRAKREAVRLAKQRRDQLQQDAHPQEQAPIMAFGGDEQPKTAGFFGN